MKLFAVVLNIAGLKTLTDTACQYLGLGIDGQWLIAGIDGHTYDVAPGTIQFITTDELTEEEFNYFNK